MDITATTSSKRLLLVDDQADVRDVLRAHLEAEGYQVFEAADGTEAIPLARELLPELIVVDIYMPTLNGISLCQRLRQIPELTETPILVVTGFASEEILQKALDAGASDYLTKPISWPLLHHRLRQLLHLSKAAEARRQAEQRWERLMEDLPGLLYRTTAEPKRAFRAVSPGCLSLTGYLPETLLAASFPGQSILIHPEDQESVWSQVQEALRQRAPYTMTYRLLTATGREKTVWEKGRGIYGLGGEVVALEGMILPFPVVERALED